MMRNDFAVLILSHGRPNNIKTIKALENANYTGKYYIVIDNEDKTKDEYIKLYGDKVIIFDKQAISDNPKYDKFDNNNNNKVIFFARNASMEIAKDLGLKYYIQFDDDYNRFEFRYEKDGVLKHDIKINNMEQENIHLNAVVTQQTDRITDLEKGMKEAIETNFPQAKFIAHFSHWYEWGAMIYDRFIVDGKDVPQDPVEALRLHQQTHTL